MKKNPSPDRTLPNHGKQPPILVLAFGTMLPRASRRLAQRAAASTRAAAPVDGNEDDGDKDDDEDEMEVEVEDE